MEGAGVPAKGLTAQAYEGHYFWDTEVYVLPFLSFTQPRIARNLLRFRHSMLPHARARAREINHDGALFPWRTINGEEASAAYQAGTAQYHLNADIAFAVRRYVNTSDDREFLAEAGAELLVETARMWADLGFYADDGRFHMHNVTGPDEYTTVVNDNTYTNLMARLNLNYAAASVRAMQAEQPAAYAALVAELKLRDDEIEAWERAAAAMYVPYDERRGIHPQDANFLEREVWDLEATPPDHFPLLLHYHPLVIYRHQVIKQADVVLAMFLLGNEFSTAAQARELRLLRRAHDRRLLAIGVHPEHRRGRDRQAPDRLGVLPLRAADGPGRRLGQQLRRRPHRLRGRRLASARVRLRRRARIRRRSCRSRRTCHPAGDRSRFSLRFRGRQLADPPHTRAGDLHPRGRRSARAHDPRRAATCSRPEARSASPPHPSELRDHPPRRSIGERVTRHGPTFPDG